MFGFFKKSGGSPEPPPPLVTLVGMRDRRGQRIFQVSRNSQSWHEEEGWRIRGDRLEGYYKTSRGRWKGYILNPYTSGREFYVYKVPQAVLDGPHSACYRHQGKELYYIHFTPVPEDEDSGIRAVIRCFEEARS